MAILAKDLEDEINSLTDGAPSFYGTMKSLKRFEEAVIKAERYEELELKGSSLKGEQASMVALLEDLRSAVQQCRHWAGTELQELPVGLTALEKPLAENLLQERKKIIDPRQSKKMEMLDQMIQQVKSVKTVRESNAVIKLEKQREQQQKAYSKVKTEFEKWQAGQHTYKTVDDMSQAKRDYASGAKDLETLLQKIEAARCERRDEEEDSDSEEDAIWSQPVQKPGMSFRVVNLNGKVKKAWGSENLTLAQKMQLELFSDTPAAEIDTQRARKVPKAAIQQQSADFPTLSSSSSTVGNKPEKAPQKERIPKREEGDVSKNQDDGFQTVANKKFRPMRPVAPKQEQHLPASSSDEDEQEQPQANLAEVSGNGGKKQGVGGSKNKKKKKSNKQADEDWANDASEEAARGRKTLTTSWFKQVSNTFETSVVKQYAKYAIGPCKKPGTKVEELRARLAPRNALGLTLTANWNEFLADFGVSKSKNSSRVSENLARYWPQYLLILFGLSCLDSMATFGLLFFCLLLQMGLLFAPDHTYLAVLTPSRRVPAVWVSHALTWLFFIRQIVISHWGVLIACVVAITAHVTYKTEHSKVLTK